MKVVVFSCDKYSDAWFPFFYFFRKFWPDCPFKLHLVTDKPVVATEHSASALADKVHVIKKGWNEIVTQFCHDNLDEPILMLLEDYWLTAPVKTPMIQYALSLLDRKQDSDRPAAGCVRLYPCPGGDEEVGDLNFARVSKDAPYRISTQAAIWQPNYLREFAGRTKTPWSFELDGTKFSREYVAPIYAFKRNVQPWPIEYICTAIVQGVWQANAYNYAKHHGIAGQIDWTKRPMQVAE